MNYDVAHVALAKIHAKYITNNNSCIQARRKQSRSGLTVIQTCSRGSGGMLLLENFEEISALRAIFLHFD